MKFIFNLLFSICVTFILAYLSFFLFGANFIFYKGFSLITNNQTFSSSDMSYCYITIILYLFNLRSNMDISLNSTKVFDDYTLSHMLDVKNVFNGFLIITIILSILFVFIIKFTKNKKILSYKFHRNFLIILSIIFFSIFFYAIIDFDSFFNVFHKLFFEGDSWMFPDGSPIIMLLTFEFFYTIAILIAITFIAFNTIFYIFLKKSQNKNH